MNAETRPLDSPPARNTPGPSTPTQRAPTETGPTETEPTETGNRRWWALGAIALAMLAIGLDTTVLSVALPTLADRLHASTTALQWFVAAYTLVIATVVLPGGLMGDRYGRRRILVVGLLIFAAGSIACAYAPTAGWFIAARIVAGIGAACAMPASLSLIATLFGPAERPRAVGIWAAANFVAMPLGPILGGWLLQNYWWGWIFLVNLPVVAVGVVVVLLVVPESRASRRPGLDPLGIVLSCGGLALLTYGVIRAGDDGWADRLALASMAAGLIALVGFGFWQRRLARVGGQPLVDVALFGSRAFTWGTVLSSLAGFALVGVLFTAPQYFQAILRADAMGSGVRLLPMIGGVVVGAGLADRVVRLIGPRLTIATGFGILLVGLVLGSRTTVGSGVWFGSAWTAICGVGLAFGLASAASLALGELSADRAGIGSAVLGAVQKLGMPLGAAMLGSVLDSAYQSRLALGSLPSAVADTTRESVFGGLAVAERLGSPALADMVRGAFVHGMDTMLWACAGVALIGLVAALVFVRGQSRS